jgi:hypothetical protein
MRVAGRRWVKIRQLGRVGLAKDHGAGETQCGDDLSIGSCWRAVCAQLTVGQRRHTGDIDDVLYADWNAMQRPAKTPRLGLAVEQIGFCPRAVVRDMAPTLHHGIYGVDAR